MTILAQNKDKLKSPYSATRDMQSILFCLGREDTFDPTNLPTTNIYMTYSSVQSKYNFEFPVSACSLRLAPCNRKGQNDWAENIKHCISEKN